MKFKFWISCAILGLALLGGCYESPSFTFHEPGLYKGKQDPLLAKQRQPEQQQQLIERFKNVQTDR